MEKSQPLQAVEKGLLADEIQEQQINQAQRRGGAPLFKKILIGAAVLYAGSTLLRSGHHPHHGHAAVDVETGLGGNDRISAYWNAISSKGMGKAVKDHKKHDHHHHHHGDHHGKHDHHDHHDKHKHKDKHGKHDHHDKHGKHETFMPPKLAEKKFLEVPNAESVRAASRRYTDHAHIAGSGWDYLDALTLKAEWEAALGIPISGPEDFVFEAGSSESQERVLNAQGKIGVWVDTYYPTMNTPVESFVTLHSDPPVHAKLREDIVEGDPDSVLRDEVRVFHGLSVSGHVKAQYVYAGYGRKKDFELLAEKGIDLNGKIAITKYGGVFRGLKIKAAQEAGAVGVLIYSDPGDDGEYTEEHGHKAYPDGPARQPSSVQRGSVQFLSKYPGDPVTPGLPAYRNATRVEGGNVPDIPSLPLSYEDAIPLLKALNGKGSKVSDYGQEWVGGLEYKGVEYWTGPSDLELEMKNEVNTRVMPIWNTMATIPGHISDEVVIVGNHRDAWVLGAADPSSGTASMYEMIRGLGVLLKQGWKPLRTIVLASWDAEEYGLIGSTEWTEDFGDWLSNHTVAYLNMDVSVGGNRFVAGASPSLSWLVRDSAEKVLASSNKTKTVWDARLDGSDWETWRAEKQGLESGSMALSVGKDDNWVKPLGSGSDFTSFLQRFGIASTNIGYSGGPKDPVYHYHSIYDSFTWQEKFDDPGFHKHVDAAKVFGLMTLRMADSLVLPINTTQYSMELVDYLANVQHIADAGNYSQNVNFTNLSSSIHRLINASVALDDRTSSTLKKLEKVLPKPPKHPKRSFAGLAGFFSGKSGHCCDKHRSASSMSLWNPSTEKLEKAGWPEIPHIPGIPGTPKPKDPKEPHPPTPPSPPSPPSPPDHPTPPAPPHHPHHPHHPHPPHHPHHPPPHPDIPKHKIKEIRRLLDEIRSINKLLQQFEGGFISEAGIRDREWYRHKGVAPGKWLGYGATTFPALTEALTIEHSAKLAQEESDDLAKMIKKMAHKLEKAV